MRNVKRFFALCLCAIGCFSLVSCGTDGGKEDSSKSNAGSEQSSMPGDDVGTDIFN